MATQRKRLNTQPRSSGSLPCQPLGVGPKRNSAAAQRLFSQTDTGEFCDLRLVFNGQHLWAHSSILVLKSHYFDLLLNNCSFASVDKSNIEMSGIFRSKPAAEAILRFFYLSTITITEDNVYDVLHGASLLLIDDLESVVEQFLINNLVPTNRCEFYLTAKRYNLQLLLAQLREDSVFLFTTLQRSPQLLERLDYEELEYFVRHGLPVSSVPEVIRVILTWFEIDPTGRLQEASTLLDYVVHRPSLGVLHLKGTAATEAENLLLGRLVTISKWTRSFSSACQEGILELAVVPTVIGSGLLTVKCCTLTMRVYLTATNEWLCLLDSCFPEAVFPKDFIENSCKSCRKLFPIRITADQVIFAFDGLGPYYHSEYLMIYNFVTKELRFHSKMKGAKTSYTFANDAIVAVTYRAKNKKEAELEMSELSTVSGASWKVVAQIPLTLDHARGSSSNETLIHLRLHIAPDRTRIVFQVRELTENNLTKFKVIGHKINHDGTRTTLTDPIMFNQSINSININCIRTVLFSWNVYICFGGGRLYLYDMRKGKWKEFRNRQTLARNKFANVITQHTSTYSTQAPVSGIVLPKAMYSISNGYNGSSFQCQVKRVDLQSGTVEELPPTPYMHLDNSNTYPGKPLLCHGYCGGLINTDAVAKLVVTSNALADHSLQCRPRENKRTGPGIPSKTTVLKGI